MQHYLESFHSRHTHFTDTHTIKLSTHDFKAHNLGLHDLQTARGLDKNGYNKTLKRGQNNAFVWRGECMTSFHNWYEDIYIYISAGGIWKEGLRRPLYLHQCRRHLEGKNREHNYIWNTRTSERRTKVTGVMKAIKCSGKTIGLQENKHRTSE